MVGPGQVRQAEDRHQGEQHRHVQAGHRVIEHRGRAHHDHQDHRPRRRRLVQRDQRRHGHHQQEERGDQIGVAALGEAVERAGQHQPGQRRRTEPVLPAPQPGGQRVRAQRGHHEQHGGQHRVQRQRREAGEPADHRGQRGEAGRVDQIAGVLPVREHLLGHDRVRILVPAADVGPFEADHAGVGAAGGQHQDRGQAAVPHHGQRPAERPGGRLCSAGRGLRGRGRRVRRRPGLRRLRRR